MKKIVFLGILFIMGFIVKAETITFTFDASDNGLTTITKISGGLTLTVDNIIKQDPGGNRFRADGDGIGVSGASDFMTFVGTEGVPVSMDFTFDQQVQLLSFDIGFNSNDRFSISFSQGGNISNEIPPIGTGDRNFSNQFIATSGIPVVLTNTPPVDNFETLQLLSITVDSISVPEPNVYALLSLLSLGYLLYRWRYQKNYGHYH